MENKNLAVIFAFLIVAVMISKVSALGIAPGRISLDFSPGLEKSVDFSVLNTEKKEMNVAFTVRGDLASYVSIENDLVKFAASEDSKKLVYKIRLPVELSPGLHRADIVAVELPKDVESREMLVRATVSVVTQVYVYVPYPGKYLEADFNIVNKEDSNVVSFYIPLISRGNKDIEGAGGIIEIYRGDDKITSLAMGNKKIKAGEKAELAVSWSPDVLPGGYRAVAILNYDSQEKRFERMFNVGNESLKVVSIGTNNFKLGQVAKISILVQNKLSDAVKGASAILKVYDSELKSVADLKSESYEIPPLSNTEMVAYWDTEKLGKGEYSSELKINYGGKFINKGFKIKVSQNSISFTGVGFVVSQQAGQGISTTTILFIVIGFLILVNAVWLIYWMKSKKFFVRRKA